MPPLVTLTTDFGESSPYVAAMKGVLLGINPDVTILDLSHSIGPQDLRHAAFFLIGAVPYFPPNVIHVVVVDPGVGSERALLHVELGGHRLVLPDNGCWTPLADRLGVVPRVHRIEELRFRRATVSATFHGRDILAPAAAHLSLGVTPDQLGPTTTDWVTLNWPRPERTDDGWRGEILFVDGFGNLITNLPAEASGTLWLNDHPVSRRVRTYSDAEAGTPIVLTSSSDLLEIAVVQGSAARLFGASAGSPVVAAWRSSPLYEP